MTFAGFRYPFFPRRPWLHGLGALTLLLLLSWMNSETGAIFGFATAYLIPIVWAGLTLAPGWSVLIGALASAGWLITVFQTPLPRSFSNEDWLTLPLIYPILSLLLSHLSQAQRNLAEALERERTASRTDMLTGLLNRRGLFEAMEALRGGKERFSERTLVFLDLDHFKKLNDRMGHEAGDALLADLGRLLKQAVPDAVVSRIGGDEFVVVFPRGRPSLLKRRITALRRSVNAVCSRYSAEVTATMGAAHFRKAWPHPGLALSVGDTLMYRAKFSGRNRLHCRIVEPKDWIRLQAKPANAGLRARRPGGLDAASP